MMAVAVAKNKPKQGKMKQALLIFVKNAVKGKVKTRLAATIGDDAALEVYNRLLVHTENSTKDTCAHKIVLYSDFIDSDDIWKEELYDKQIQSGKSLGERMRNAFDYAFRWENEKVAIIGSDCFEINSDIIDQAFEKLGNCEVVIGPALDGGYYLLALNKLHNELFVNIDWSTDKVLSQTIEICENNGLKVARLQALSDIDNEEDLNKFYKNSQHLK
ncbi:Glycosyltransferase [Arcticibacter svalbardensis MN12-7]|uniref:Glycosyltransferase n=2 Tax=Arcticibacter TaxID=1288026 RepID=R9GUK4_9SPHI|nr:Glycosyltransferase [Arcticibacter svalbardensis MN12-7]